MRWSDEQAVCVVAALHESDYDISRQFVAMHQLVAIRVKGHRASSLSRSRLSRLRANGPTNPILSGQSDREGTLCLLLLLLTSFGAG
jgi:hypothetical protein